MALGDLLASRFSNSQSSVIVGECSNSQNPNSNSQNPNSNSQNPNSNSTVSVDDDNVRGRVDCEIDFGINSYGIDSLNAVINAMGATNMAFLPETVVFRELRHDAFEALTPSGPADHGIVSKWRPKDRMKTGCVALVLCLNIGVDPPDVIKISPCARLECWIDPFSMPTQRALETIGNTLIHQYERLQSKAQYKIQLDPTVEEVQKLCTTSRKHAKSERVLFHYNGHGVPKPTVQGEIWLFNKSYTQYVPLHIHDLDSWLKTPSICVFDCSAAGMIIKAFVELQECSTSSSPGSSTRDCLVLAACEAHETLPQSHEFPADLFTCCLTTPIKMALRWLCPRSLLLRSLDFSLIDRIPGRQTDRKTLLGELNWILTAVMDTIAWNVLPHDLFQRLFRQDLLVSSMFRNFLLAERIMRAANCSPVSYPTFPPTHQHHMWDVWDMAAELCLAQLPMLIDDPNAEYQPSTFFNDQLTAFEVWLDHGSEHKKPPEQLPIVLQVLLSQCHRFRALMLLGRFLDMGPWAIDMALSVGIFPYILKLLMSPAPEIRHILVFIWTKILVLDKSCQVDVVKEGGHRYFVRFLDSVDVYPEQRAMAAFVLAVVVDGHTVGQQACVGDDLIQVCLKHLRHSTQNNRQTEPLFLQWLCLCLGKLWEDFTEAQTIGLREDAPAKLAHLLSVPQPEVRASAAFALGTLLDVTFDSSRDGNDEHDDNDEKLKAEISVVKTLLDVASDGSPLVRAEVAVALSRFAFGHNRRLKSVATAYWKPLSSPVRSSLPSFGIRGSGSGDNLNQYSQSDPFSRAEGDNQSAAKDPRASSSSPLTTSGIMHGSPLPGPGSPNDSTSNVVVNHARPRQLENTLYSQCVLAMRMLEKDPSPRVSSIGRRLLSIIGIEHVVANSVKIVRIRPGEYSSTTNNLAGVARSFSLFDMSGGLPLTFGTPPDSSPRANASKGTGIRRVCSLELGPRRIDSGLANPILGSLGSSGEHGFLPQSTIYKWSCNHFSKPVLTATNHNEEVTARQEKREKIALANMTKCQHSGGCRLRNPIACWDTKFEAGTKTALLHPFSAVVVAADENERIRVWNYEETALVNSFPNHDDPNKGISRICFVNELDDSLLLIASSDGNVRVWKEYMSRGKQKLVSAFSSIHGLKPNVGSLNAVVDWQQQSGYMYASGEISSTMVWDLGKEQCISSILLASDHNISALAASQAHGGLFATGFVDGSVSLFDIRTPEALVCVTRPHTQRVSGIKRVVEIGFQPGFDLTKIVSASQAGDIQFLDIRNHIDPYITIDAHRGSLTALTVHRHAPIVASGSSKQLIKVFNLEGEQLSTIRYSPTFMAQKPGSLTCLAFHPYDILLAAGSADACVSVYSD